MSEESSRQRKPQQNLIWPGRKSSWIQRATSTGRSTTQRRVPPPASWRAPRALLSRQRLHAWDNAPSNNGVKYDSALMHGLGSLYY